MNIKIREFELNDYQDLLNLVIETWRYHKIMDNKTALKLAKVFLCDCLNNTTYARILTVNDKVEGVILAKDNYKHKSSFYLSLKQDLNILTLIMSSKGRKVSKLFTEAKRINNILLEENNLEYDSELSLFILSDKLRNKGFGKLLFKKMINYLKKEGCNNLYLFADETCNLSFFKKMNMSSKITTKYNFDIKNNKYKTIFYLYEMKI